MIIDKIPHLIKFLPLLVKSKSTILDYWLLSKESTDVLSHHCIDTTLFKEKYASNVFEYFVSVIKVEQNIGQCPVMNELLEYFNDKDIAASELFIICSNFRKAMIDISYALHVNSKEYFDEVSYIFDLNFSGLLKLYTDTIFEKEQEIKKNVQLLNEYKRAIDKSALVSKTDENGIITYVNDNLCELSGYKREELIGHPHSIMRHFEMKDDFFDTLWKEIKADKLFKSSIKNSKKNGEYFYVDTTIVPILNPFSQEREYMAIGYEITNLVDARLEALEANESKDYFLSNMSHEIRTPLNAILGFVGLMKEDTLSKKHTKYLDIIHTSGETLLSIINDILDFSKLRKGEFSIHPQVFNLHVELSHTLELFVASANAKNITLLSYIDPQIPQELVADSLRIKQIVSNLLSNAIKFTPTNGFVELNAEYENSTLIISVKDSGVGISQKKIEHIFDAFSQVENSTTREVNGSGLGLFICKKLANHMQGDISVDSKLTQGSEFILSLEVQSIKSSKALVYDTALFKKLHLSFLMKDESEQLYYHSLKRYLDAFDIALHVIECVDALEYDILFFVDSLISDELRQKILTQDALSIALVTAAEDRFSNNKNISSLQLPLYCSKIYEVFLEALDLSISNNTLIMPNILQRKFKGHVLIVEDNSANVELLKTLLQKYALSYFIASDGYEAIAIFKTAQFDLVLMDEQMPNLNGIEATQKILQFEKEQSHIHTPIISLSANVIQSMNAKTRLDDIFDARVSKPIDIKALELVFENYLEELFDIKERTRSSYSVDAKIYGIDKERLKNELLLQEDELLMLVETFVAKMRGLLPELKRAIMNDNIEEITRLAHSIKGSSANFRIKSIEKIASVFESSKTEKKSQEEYLKLFDLLDEEFEKIYIEE